jgi:hypothetical protein
MNIAGTILCILRLFEVIDIKKIFSFKRKKKPDNNSIELSSTITESNIDGRQATKRQMLDTEANNEAKEKEIAFSSALTSTYLIEYMYFIIQGILKIGKEVNDTKEPYPVRYFYILI